MIGRSGDWLSARVGDEIMMMSASSGRYIGINEVGARIWTIIEQPTAKDAICEMLTEEFEVDADTCRREVEAFVAEMRHQGAITDKST